MNWMQECLSIFLENFSVLLRKKEKVSPGVPGAQFVTVVNRAGEDASIGNTELQSLFLQKLLIRTFSDVLADSRKTWVRMFGSPSSASAGPGPGFPHPKRERSRTSARTAGMKRFLIIGILLSAPPAPYR